MATPQFSFRATPETVAAINELQVLLADKRGGDVSKAEAITYAVLRAVEDLKAGDTAVDRVTDAKLQASIARERREAERDVLRQCQEHLAEFMSRYLPAVDPVKPAKRAVVGKPSGKHEVITAGIGGPIAQFADRHAQPSSLDENRRLAVEGIIRMAERAAHSAASDKSKADVQSSAPASVAEVAKRLRKSLADRAPDR